MWDGKDYPQFLYDIKKKYTINETTHNPYGKDDYEKLWEIECERWGGATAIEEHWQKYKLLDHKYIHCDIVKDFNKDINKVESKDTSVIWWSNVFHTVNTHYTRRLIEVKDLYIDWLENLT